MQYIQTPQDAELNAAQRMRELGFTDAQVTVGGADGGIDVHSSTALAQVKWRGGMVGRPELQALFGARGSDFSKLLLFFAASDYSQHAAEYADQSRIAIFVYDPIGTLTAKNRHAALLLDGGHFNLVGRGTQPVLPLQMSNSKRGFWSQDARPFLENTAWPFLKVHWRIVGAIGFTIGLISGISITVSPDPGQDRIDGVLTLSACLIGAPIFWWLSLTDYTRKKSKKYLNGDDISTQPPSE